MNLAEYIAQERAKEPNYEAACKLDAEIGIIQERMKQDMINLAAKVKELKALKLKHYIVKVSKPESKKQYRASVAAVSSVNRLNTKEACLKHSSDSAWFNSVNVYDFETLKVI